VLNPLVDAPFPINPFWQIYESSVVRLNQCKKWGDFFICISLNMGAHTFHWAEGYQYKNCSFVNYI